jgi:hypothetical protein
MNSFQLKARKVRIRVLSELQLVKAALASLSSGITPLTPSHRPVVTSSLPVRKQLFAFEAVSSLPVS